MAISKLRSIFALILAVTALVTNGGCSGATQNVRVLSYNIHHGEGTDGVFDLHRIAAVIRESDPDLVSLQEVDRSTNRSGAVDQAGELARLTGMHVAYGSAMDYDGGAYGVAILSRVPILDTRNQPLPHTPGYEPRTALAVTVELGSIGPVVFIATHLQHNSETDRVAQAREICRVFVEEAGDVAAPMILAGDLNAQPGSAPMSVFMQSWRASDAADQPTFPSVHPDRKIDYVLLHPQGRNWRVLTVRVLDAPVASDHCPLLVEVRHDPLTRD